MFQNVKVICASQPLSVSDGEYVAIVYEDFVIDLPFNTVTSMDIVYDAFSLYIPMHILNVILIYRAML